MQESIKRSSRVRETMIGAAPRWLMLAVLTLPAFAGCIQDPAVDAAADASDGATIASALLAPVPDTITGLAAAATVEFGAGNDLAFHGDHVFVATHNNGMHVVNAADPANPVEVAVIDCSGKDIGVIDLGDRVIATISSQGDDGCPDAAPSGGIRLVDVTDPATPIVMGQVPLTYGSHTHTPYGNTGLIYNSAYNLAANPMASPMDHHRSEIVNVSDPENPFVETEFMFPETSSSIGCHDILAEPERNRAICGGISETMIWDTTDPLAPVIVSTIHNPALTIHHSAATARDGTLLILGDEWAGVLAPGCHPVSTAPTGAIWFYDISDAASPQVLGFVPPPAGDPGTVCTAHNFNVIEGHDMLVSGFYTGGTLLIDFTDPANPVVVDQEKPTGTSSWASYYYRGAIFSGDGGRGLDVYLLEGDEASGDAATAGGLLSRLSPALTS